EKRFFSPHVQKCLGGACKRRFRQVFRTGGGPHCQLSLAPQASHQCAIGLANRGLKVFRQRSFQNSRPCLMTFLRKLFQILGIQIRETRFEFCAQALFFQKPPVAIGGDREPVQDANPFGFQRAKHLPEGSVLAAYQRQVPHANLGKIHCKSGLHKILHPLESCIQRTGAILLSAGLVCMCAASPLTVMRGTYALAPRDRQLVVEICDVLLHGTGIVLGGELGPIRRLAPAFASERNGGSRENTKYRTANNLQPATRIRMRPYILVVPPGPFGRNGSSEYSGLRRGEVRQGNSRNSTRGCASLSQWQACYGHRLGSAAWRPGRTRAVYSDRRVDYS